MQVVLQALGMERAQCLSRCKGRSLDAPRLKKLPSTLALLHLQTQKETQQFLFHVCLLVLAVGHLTNYLLGSSAAQGFANGLPTCYGW